MSKTPIIKGGKKKGELSKVGTPTRARAKSTAKKAPKAKPDIEISKEEKAQERTRLGKAAMLEALKASLGVVSTAAKKVGISRECHRKWMLGDEEYAEGVRSVNLDAVDFGRSMLYQQMRGEYYREKVDKKGERTIYRSAPDTRAIIFFLETQGKDEGFSKRQELTGANGSPLEAGGGAVIVLPSNERDVKDNIDDQYKIYLEGGGTPYANMPLPEGYNPKPAKLDKPKKKPIIIKPKVKSK